MDAYKDAIMAHAIYYPSSKSFLATAIAVRHLVFGARWYGGPTAAVGMTTLGMLTASSSFAQRFFRPIQDSAKIQHPAIGDASAERIFKLPSTPRPRSSRRRSQSLGKVWGASSSTTCGSHIDVPQPDPNQPESKNGNAVHIPTPSLASRTGCCAMSPSPSNRGKTGSQL